MPVHQVYVGQKQCVPVKAWTPQIDNITEVQLRQTASLPFVFKHVSAMPDAHYGMGSTVGTVIATHKAIIPAAVGVDIGCGMLAFKTNLDLDTAMARKFDLFDAIEKFVPVGFTEHKSPKATWKGFDDPLYAQVKDMLDKAKNQLGTLGGGNHFIEVCRDTENNVWVMLHSGSRKIGNVIAQEHIKTAQKIMEEWHIDLPNKDLAYLVDTHPEFARYIHDLRWAQDYAKENRAAMFRLVFNAIKGVMGDFDIVGDVINCHHNYTEMEHHFDHDVWVTRKGAIRARLGDLGIIPGSMGDKSYIVRGKGCAEAFCSAPHGAGRLFSRGAAKKQFTVEDVVQQTEGIACKKDASVIDELPGVYKRIDEVMEYSNDLVEVVAELKQFVCVKG